MIRVRGAASIVTAWGFVVGCQSIANIETRKVDPRGAGCTLPTEGGAKLRVAHLVAREENIDICVRETGGAYGRPVVRDGGKSCPNGLSYGEMSAPFAVPLGQIDVKLIPSGKTCSAPALVERIGVQTFAERAITAAEIGGNGEVPSLLVLADVDKPLTELQARYRFVNAIPASKPLTFGYVSEAQLPTTVQEPITPPMAFGKPLDGDAKVLIGVAESEGYVVLPAIKMAIGSTDDATAHRALMASVFEGGSASRTIFAVGAPEDSAFPVRALVCDDAKAAGILSDCHPSPLATLAIDTFSVGLYGANAPEEIARRPKLLEMLRTHDADAMCIVEAGRDQDRRDLAAAAAQGNMPYSVVPAADLNTPLTDPRDANGIEPPKPDVPPCGGTVDLEQVEKFYGCLIDRCNTNPGNAAGTLDGTAKCASNNCAVYGAALAYGTMQDKRCLNCVIDQLVSFETFTDGKRQCLTDKREPYAFRGSIPSMVVSRLKVLGSETYVLSSTNWRRAVIRAELELERGKSLDFYCIHTTSMLGEVMQYSGNYADLASPRDPYWQEADLQAKRITEWVVSNQKARGRPAILAGHISSSEGPVGSTLIARDPEFFIPFKQAFKEPLPRTFVPVCTWCKSNPLAGIAGDYWLNRTFTYGMDRSEAVEWKLLFTAPDAVTLSDGATKGPLSDEYGSRVRLLRP